MMRKLKITEMHRLTVEQFKDCVKMPVVVVLDDVRSMYNVGSVFRTSDAYRINGIALCGITACPPHPEIHKTALGAEDSVDWQHFDTAMDAVKFLHDEGYKVFAIEQAEGSTALQDWQFGNFDKEGKNNAKNPDEFVKIAVVLGNEVKGVHQEVVDACDGCIELPQFGTKHSLNVSTTAGIVIWHLAQQYLLKR